MSKVRPNFMKSSYFVDEPGNWHLKQGAPIDMQAEFNDYMDSLEELEPPGTINGNSIIYPFYR